MLRRILSTLTVAATAFALVACSDSSPTQPGNSPSPTSPNSSGPGSYQLTFFINPNSPQPVSSLPFGQELFLRAHVDDSSGRPAKDGRVTFEYCSLNGRPKNDITNIDEAPIEACADGTATWTPLDTVVVQVDGTATMFFGAVRVTPMIGFRFQYLNSNPASGGIASGVSAPANFTFHP